MLIPFFVATDGRCFENLADKAARRGNEVVLGQFQVRAASLGPTAPAEVAVLAATSPDGGLSLAGHRRVLAPALGVAVDLLLGSVWW